MSPLNPADPSTVPPTAAYRHPPAGGYEPPLFPTLPGFEVVRELGRGGMGVVYEAKQVSLGRPVAIKMVLGGQYADPQDGLRFLAEARNVAAIRHPNVVHIYEFATHDNRPYIVMEYVDGGSLFELFRSRGRMSASEAAAMLGQIARGVQAAHEAGIVHRDLKPGNVLLDKSGNPKVTDFGLAKRDGGGGLTRSGDVMGTPTYMAPEQARAQNKTLGPPTDVYALGVILYEALTGWVPFSGDDPIGVLMRVVDETPKPIRDYAPDVPKALELICLKCLAKNPAHRYPTAGHLADALWRFLAGEVPSDAPAAAEPASVKGVTPPAKRRVPVWVIALAAGLVVAAGLGGWALTLLFKSPAAPTSGVSPPSSPAAVVVAPTGEIARLLASPDWEWGPPVSLGDGINTDGRERLPTLSRDELTLVFDRGTDKLFVSRRAIRTDPFPRAELLPAAVNDLKPMTASLSGDGLELAFHTRADGQLWVCKRATADQPFGPPERGPEAAFPTQYRSSACLTDDGLTLLLTVLPRGNVGHAGGGDIAITRRKARTEPFPPAELLPGEVNTPVFDTASWLSPDGLVLFHVSQADGSEVCQYHTRKTADEPFGPGVKFDPFAGQFTVGKPWLSPDGRRVFFHSRAPGQTHLDLWVSELRPKAK